MIRFGWAVPVLLLGACAPAAAPAPAAPPAPEPVPDSAPEPVAPPQQAARLGWMPLAGTNVPDFARRYPRYDGRGVLIAILDAGVDPAIAGLGRLPDGGPKILDLRDFSGEGRVPLVRAELDGEVVRAGPVRLRGAGRIRGLTTGTEVYAGALHELTLGEPPAADLNGNGYVGDTLAVVVARASDGWLVLADRDGDGSLDGERPARDYLKGGDTFGWSRAGRPAPVTVAVNLEDRGAGQAPALALYFDTSGHGTHVAGIAAGHDLYGIPELDGVAPGASLLGLKIANDARGGISTTGAIVRAMEYAIRFANDRRMPLVINLSFGVGNEAEGQARIDVLVDSILAANPAVVMTLSAGNDGPGLSTMGFPASARRGITVGATYPGAFLPPTPEGRRRSDAVAFFSARGGELAQPDLVAPGIAYSAVPRFDIGEEIKNGTSMAAPHVAGLAARLLSGLADVRKQADAASIKRALMLSASPLEQAGVLDQGVGQPDVAEAWALLTRLPPADPVMIDAAPGVSAALLFSGAADSVARFTIRSGGRRLFRLTTDVPWLAAPDQVANSWSATIPVQIRANRPREPGVHTGIVSGWDADSIYGPAFRLVTTVVVPRPLPADEELVRLRIPEGQLRRIPILADSGRGLRLQVGDPRGAPLLAFLFEPGGMPWRGGNALAAGGEDSVAVFEIGGRDARKGVYELVLMAGPALAVSPDLIIDPAPARLAAERRKDQVTLTLAPVSTAPVTVSGELIGAERGAAVSGRGSADVRLPFTLPAWARHVVVELVLERDQWPLFTDFGLTLVEESGRQLATSPMNYAIGRLETDLPEGGDRAAEIVLSPGFADPGAEHRWSGRVAIRLYAETPVPLGTSLGSTFRLPGSPWKLPDAFFPLANFIMHANGRQWIRETGLPELPGPLMP